MLESGFGVARDDRYTKEALLQRSKNLINNLYRMGTVSKRFAGAAKSDESTISRLRNSSPMLYIGVPDCSIWFYLWSKLGRQPVNSVSTGR